MSYDKKLAQRIRCYLDSYEVSEKPMFGSLCFMVNGKMCVCAGNGQMLCRLSVIDYAEAIKQSGIQPMSMRGRLSKHYVHIDEKLLEDEGLAFWLDKALAFNNELTTKG